MRLSGFIAGFIIMTALSCAGKTNEEEVQTPGPGCEYASYFGVIYNDDDDYSVKVKSFSTQSNEGNRDWIKLNNNIEYKRVVCMSTSHLSYIESLGEIERVVGVSGGQYISNSYIQSGLSSGKIADIGYEGSLNYELLISLEPDLVLTYGIEGENNQYIEKIKQFGIPVIALGDYLENHPLGKLEYIKFFGAIFNKMELADSIYEHTKLRYIKLRSLSEKSKKRNILINAPWKEVWYIPGKSSYMNILAEDAGGLILGAEVGKSYTKAYSIEEVYIMSAKADVWLNPNTISTLSELKSVVPMFSNITPVKDGRVFNNTKLSTAGGGSQFWERGVMEPDTLLMDLITILHPTLIKDHNPKYYLKIQ